MRAYRGLGRDRIGRIGPYRIGAQLRIRGKYNRIGGFIGNYRKGRHWAGRRDSIRWPAGSVTVYRKNNKPALGPLGDSLDDFE
jgi:hypothetical protein